MNVVTRAVQRLRRRSSNQYGRDGRGVGRLTGGGITNQQTGMGTGLDHTESTFFQPTWIWSQYPLEIIAVQSWAARKFINIPVDDMFIRWRHWTDDLNNGMSNAETEHKVAKQLASTLKAARQYGTGLLMMMTDENRLTEPLNTKQIRPGDLKNLLVANRYEASVAVRDLDPMSATFGQPLIYDVFMKGSSTFRIHATRVIRFDGITAPSDSGFTAYDWDWGVSELIPVITSLLEDQTVATGIAHLSQEASIPILSVSRLAEARAGEFAADDPDAPSVDEIGSALNRYKSSYRVMMIDKDREAFERVAVQFGGLSDLLDKFQARVAAAADIPQTRWMGRSPAGMNATGESDMTNYVNMIEAMRNNKLTPEIAVLDEVVARSAGLGSVPEFTWASLFDRSPMEQAETAKLVVQATREAIDAAMIDEDEGRAAIKTNELFGGLEGDAPEIDDEPMDPYMDPFVKMPKPAPGGGDAGDDGS